MLDITISQYITAISDSNGTIMNIAANLGVDWKTARDHIEASQELKDALEARQAQIQEINRDKTLEAIAGCGSNVTNIARALGCNWETANRYIHKWPETLEAFLSAKETLVDRAESVISKAMDSPDAKVALDAAKYVVSRQGKKRGWTERQEIEDVSTKPLNIKVIWGEDDEVDEEVSE